MFTVRNFRINKKQEDIIGEMTMDEFNALKNEELKSAADNSNTANEEEEKTVFPMDVDNKNNDEEQAKESDDDSLTEDRDDEMSIMSTTTTTTTSRSRSPNSRLNKTSRKGRPAKIVKPLFKYK